MTIDRMRFEIKLRWNKLNSNHKPDLPDAYLDDLINDAINEYVEMFYSGSNPRDLNVGFEVTQQRIDMLSTLVVPQYSATGVLVKPNIYKIDLSTFNPEYKHFLTGFVIVENCNDLKVPIDIIRHNDLPDKLLYKNTEPSLRWLRSLGAFKQEGSGTALYIYTDSNFDATNVELEYLRKPARVFSGTYETLERSYGDLTYPTTGDPKVDCDLPENYHTVVVDIVVQNLARIFEDPNKLAITEEKILKTT